MQNRRPADSHTRPAQHEPAKEGQTDCNGCEKNLYIIGIGPGHADYICPRAKRLLSAAQTVAGYRSYIELIRPLIKDKPVISTGMTQEVKRVTAAIDTALAGKSCALVCSGDPGIYAMAALAFEICQKRGIRLTGPQNGDGAVDSETLSVEVVPGIPALSAGASLLGAPLSHDFAVISLSDLLTSWEVIAQRIQAAAAADFVIVIYNPKSKKRDWQLNAAQQIILRHRSPDTAVGIVTGAMRENQAITIVPLSQLDQAEVDMQTIVFVGNSHTVRHGNFLITPRGYAQKYRLAKEGG